MSNGNPFSNWIISNQYPTAPQPQPTAPEFGATLPGDTTQPPDGDGGEPVTTYKNLGDSSRPPTGATHMRVAWRKRVQKTSAVYELHWRGQSELIPINPDSDDIMLVWFQEEPDEPVNPNPPPVALTLPQGSKGVDVSYWQGSYGWAESGAAFGIIRCSDGMTANTTTHDANGIDRQFWANAGRLTALGIPWSIYHFLRPGSIQAQAEKVMGALVALAANDTPTKTAVFDNGVKLPAVWVDVEDGALTNAHIQEFYNRLAVAHHVGIYTGKPIWEQITAGASVWWDSIPLWIAAYGINDGNVPPWENGPFLPRGWSTAVLWQYTSTPLDKNIAGPYPTIVTPPTPPPPAETIDVAPYFTPAAQYGPKIVMQVGSGSQPMQLEKRPSDVILRKGDGNWIDGKRYQDSEQWKVENGQIKKGKDTSDAGNGGRDGYDLGWAQWIPQFVAVDQTYHSTPTVNRFDRTNGCQVYSTAVANDYLHIKAILSTWTSPANSAIVLNDVLIIEWRSGTADLNQPPNETYYFAKGIGYVGWGTHFIAEITQGQAPLTGALDCGM